MKRRGLRPGELGQRIMRFSLERVEHYLGAPDALRHRGSVAEPWSMFAYPEDTGFSSSVTFPQGSPETPPPVITRRADPVRQSPASPPDAPVGTAQPGPVRRKPAIDPAPATAADQPSSGSSSMRKTPPDLLWLLQAHEQRQAELAASEPPAPEIPSQPRPAASEILQEVQQVSTGYRMRRRMLDERMMDERMMDERSIDERSIDERPAHRPTQDDRPGVAEPPEETSISSSVAHMADDHPGPDEPTAPASLIEAETYNPAPFDQTSPVMSAGMPASAGSPPVMSPPETVSRSTVQQGRAESGQPQSLIRRRTESAADDDFAPPGDQYDDRGDFSNNEPYIEDDSLLMLLASTSPDTLPEQDPVPVEPPAPTHQPVPPPIQRAAYTPSLPADSGDQGIIDPDVDYQLPLLDMADMEAYRDTEQIDYNGSTTNNFLTPLHYAGLRQRPTQEVQSPPTGINVPPPDVGGRLRRRPANRPGDSGAAPRPTGLQRLSDPNGIDPGGTLPRSDKYDAPVYTTDYPLEDDFDIDDSGFIPDDPWSDFESTNLSGSPTPAAPLRPHLFEALLEAGAVHLKHEADRRLPVGPYLQRSEVNPADDYRETDRWIAAIPDEDSIEAELLHLLDLPPSTPIVGSNRGHTPDRRTTDYPTPAAQVQPKRDPAPRSAAAPVSPATGSDHEAMQTVQRAIETGTPADAASFADHEPSDTGETGKPAAAPDIDQLARDVLRRVRQQLRTDQERRTDR